MTPDHMLWRCGVFTVWKSRCICLTRLESRAARLSESGWRLLTTIIVIVPKYVASGLICDSKHIGQRAPGQESYLSIRTLLVARGTKVRASVRACVPAYARGQRGIQREKQRQVVKETERG
ncbi:hypothetical protein EVAR_88425_1 [Eumeta japonica]|uniref:Uncharacterized protein n=1 Tax=Eumeta variegata TaxID=151549 RepID=A0A4C1Y3I1_EUMVA|nr:hypothetical protein EVAR_88425_1 [Eumeta japonica]